MSESFLVFEAVDLPADAPAPVVSRPSASAPQRFVLTMSGSVAVVRLTEPDITKAAVIDQLSQALAKVVAMPAVRGLVVDFKRVEHASSVFLGTLLHLRALISKRKGKMAVSRVSADIGGAMRLIGMHRLVGLHADLAAAVKACL